MPGYASDLVMAGGTFIDGSTSEFSADAPLRSPSIFMCRAAPIAPMWSWPLWAPWRLCTQQDLWICPTLSEVFARSRPYGLCFP